MKTSELTGPALDWAVAKCEGEEIHFDKHGQLNTRWTETCYSPSTDWEQGGPIIEREKIGLDYYPDGGHVDGGEWGAAMCEGTIESFGRTALEAALRCYVAGKLGDEVEIPEELAGVYTCEICGARHKQEFSLTCPACDRLFESGDEVEIPEELE